MEKINLNERVVVYAKDFVATYKTGVEDRTAYNEFLKLRAQKEPGQIAEIVGKNKKTIDSWIRELEEPGAGKKPLYLHGLEAAAELIGNQDIKEPDSKVILSYGDSFFELFNILTATMMGSGWLDYKYGIRIDESEHFIKKLNSYLKEKNIVSYMHETHNAADNKQLTLGKYGLQIGRMIASTHMQEKQKRGFKFPAYIDSLERLVKKDSLAKEDKERANKTLEIFYKIVAYCRYSYRVNLPHELQQRLRRFRKELFIDGLPF